MYGDAVVVEDATDAKGESSLKSERCCGLSIFEEFFMPKATGEATTLHPRNT